MAVSAGAAEVAVAVRRAVGVDLVDPTEVAVVEEDVVVASEDPVVRVIVVP